MGTEGSAAGSPLQAIFFDFDGVILESVGIKTEAITSIVPGLSPEQREALRAYHLEHAGISRYVKFAWAYRELLGREITAEESERLGRAYSRAIYDRVKAAPFVPGIPEALEALAPTHALFVVSGTPTEEVARLAEERGVAHFFREIRGSPETKPDIVRDILSRDGLSPARSLFIGDGVTDYDAARETGLSFLARDTPDQHPAWERLRPPLVRDLRDLPEIVARWDEGGPPEPGPQPR